MKKILKLLIFTFCINSFSQTQAEMNKDAYTVYKKADKELNRVYKQILQEYKTDSLFSVNLKKSQRLWVKFRDAELAMKFPNYTDRIYGSMNSMCRVFYLKELTEKRTETLKQWIVKEIDNNDCTNSIKNLHNLDIKTTNKAVIDKKGNIELIPNMKKNHRIFGFKKKNPNSEKMILISIFTNEVEKNPFGCKYGAYYDTDKITPYSLKMLSNEGEYLKVGIFVKNNKLAEVYMKTKNFVLD